MLNKIKKDQLQARKDRDTTLATFLTTLYSEAARPGLDDGKRESTDAEVTAVIKKFIKNSNEVLANLDDDDYRALEAKNEIALLVDYLPAQLSEHALSHKIADIITEQKIDSMKGMGLVMKELKANYDGLYDGKIASKLTKEQLSQ